MTHAQPDGDGELLDARSAAALLETEQQRVAAARDPRLDLQFLAWGLAWLIGYGGVWFTTREQQPYLGPPGPMLAVLVALMMVALIITVTLSGRASSGITGGSRLRGHVYGAAWGAGYLVLFASVAAPARQQAPAAAVGVAVATGALLVTGICYLLGGALWQQRTQLVLGGWLLGCAAVGGFTGPVGVALVAALGAGLGFLAAAVTAAQRGRSRPSGIER